MRIQEFLTYLEKQKKFSKHTIKAYSIDLNQFERKLARVCEGDTSDESIDTNIIRVWIMDLSEQGVSNRSINRKITALRSYFHYLEKIDEDIVNPMSKIIAPKIPKRKMSFISKEDMQSILNEEYDEKDFISVRNHLIIEILYSTGIRRSELIGLKEKDISYSDFCFKVLGKRRKERIVIINQKIVDDLIKYIDLKHRLNIKEEFLFVDEKGKVFNEGQLYYMIHKKLLGCSVEKKSPHVFRHTCATHLIDNGAEINNVKNLLGHVSIVATEKYIHTTIEQLKKEYNNAFKSIN